MEHILGSSVGALTAFTVQANSRQLPFEIAWNIWVSLGVIYGVGMGVGIGYYQRKFNRFRSPRGGKEHAQNPEVDTV